MRLLVLFLILSSYCSAQHYVPFEFSSSKRFSCTTDSTLSDEFFFPVSADTVGELVSMRNFSSWKDGEYDAYSDSSNCSFWGGADKIVDTTWLGREISFDYMLSTLSFRNRENESIVFDLALEEGDSSLFYSNSEMSAYLNYVGLTEENVLDELDTVKHFSLSFYDQNGMTMTNLLSGLELRLSKNFGLLDMIEIQDFPQVMEHYSIVGLRNPNLGFFLPTYEDVYVWDVGDVIQFKGNFSLDYIYHITYQTITITSRTETTDSVFIDFESEVQLSGYPVNQYVSFNAVYMPLDEMTAFKKTDLVIDRPPGFITTAEQETVYSYAEDFASDCSEHTISSEGIFRVYCDSCLCYGGVDGWGSKLIGMTYGVGIGRSSFSWIPYAFGQFTASRSVHMIYSNIGGTECGEYHIVDVEENTLARVRAYPNPASEKLIIDFGELFPNLANVSLSNSIGSVVFESEHSSKGLMTLDVSAIDPGVYHLSIRSQVGIHHERVLIE